MLVCRHSVRNSISFAAAPAQIRTSNRASLWQAADAGVTAQRSAFQTRPKLVSNMINLREMRKYFN